MAVSRVNGSGWSILDMLTSTQINGIDTALTYLLDKRAGQTDTLGSIVTCSGAGRIIPSSSTGLDADTSYTILTAGSIVLPGALTSTRSYTFTNTNAVEGDRIQIIGTTSASQILVKDAVGTLLSRVGTAGVAWAEIRFNGSAWVLLRSAAVGMLQGNVIGLMHNMQL